MLRLQEKRNGVCLQCCSAANRTISSRKQHCTIVVTHKNCGSHANTGCMRCLSSSSCRMLQADPTRLPLALALRRGGIWALLAGGRLLLGCRSGHSTRVLLGFELQLGHGTDRTGRWLPRRVCCKAGKEGLQGLLRTAPVRLHAQGALHPAGRSSPGKRVKAVLDVNPTSGSI